MRELWRPERMREAQAEHSPKVLDLERQELEDAVLQFVLQQYSEYELEDLDNAEVLFTVDDGYVTGAQVRLDV